jgi:hypothetical protein
MSFLHLTFSFLHSLEEMVTSLTLRIRRVEKKTNSKQTSHRFVHLEIIFQSYLCCLCNFFHDFLPKLTLLTKSKFYENICMKYILTNLTYDYKNSIPTNFPKIIVFHLSVNHCVLCFSRTKTFVVLTLAWNYEKLPS